MKKMIISCLFIATITNLFGFTGGTGTIEDPYKVSSIVDLVTMRNDTTLLTKHFVMTRDIDMAGILTSPIGTGAGPAAFSGTFDGQGFTIKNLSLENTVTYNGLFGYTDGAEISDLNLEIETYSSSTYAGGLIGKAVDTVVTKCSVEGDLSATAVAGGIIGLGSNLTVSHCSYHGIITANRGAGGVIGEGSNLEINDCSVQGDITIGGTIYKDQRFLGGIVGDTQSSTIKGCSVQGNLSVSSSYVYQFPYSGSIYSNSRTQSFYTGGIAGKISSSVVEACSLNGVINSTTSMDLSYYYSVTTSINDFLGGIIGASSNTTVTNCAVTAELTSSPTCIARTTAANTTHYKAQAFSNTRTGGVIGESTTSVVNNCLVSGNISTTPLASFVDSYPVSSTSKAIISSMGAGLVSEALSYSTIINSFSMATVDKIGVDGNALVDSSTDSNIVNCFWDTQTSGCSSGGGDIPATFGLTTAEFKTKDFSDIWDFGNSDATPWQDSGVSAYPHLYWQTSAPGVSVIPAKTVTEAVELTFTVEASGEDLTFSLDENAPLGIEFNTTTGEFSWTPNYNQAGSYNFDVSVTNDIGTTTETISITVVDAPVPPVFTQIEEQVVIGGDLLEFTVEATDPEGEIVLYTLLGDPIGTSSITNLGGEFTWQTDEAELGTYNFTIQASDGQLNSTMVMTVYVITNDIAQLLSDTPEAQLGFKNVLVANSVENIIDENLTLYQEEFARSIDFLASDATLYQSIIDAVNAGDSTLIQSVKRGWNLISCPFADWSALTITGERVARPVYYYNVETQVYDMVNTTQQIRQGEGLWIFIDDEEVAEGEELSYFMSGQFRDDLQFSYVYGWNLIGTTTEGEKWSANNFLYSWDSSVSGYQNNTGQEMELGLGYWIFFMPPPGGPNN